MDFCTGRSSPTGNHALAVARFSYLREYPRNGSTGRLLHGRLGQSIRTPVPAGRAGDNPQDERRRQAREDQQHANPRRSSPDRIATAMPISSVKVAGPAVAVATRAAPADNPLDRGAGPLVDIRGAAPRSQPEGTSSGLEGAAGTMGFITCYNRLCLRPEPSLRISTFLNGRRSSRSWLPPVRVGSRWWGWGWSRIRASRRQLSLWPQLP